MSRDKKKNGRTGQAQHRIDVYGTPQFETEYYGSQCKGKDNYTNSELKENDKAFCSSKIELKK